MLNAIFSSVFTETTAAFTFGQFLACTAVSLILGLLIAAVYRYKSECTKSFAVTLVLMPVIVQRVIMLVNGNLGTGVAVAGAFFLVRFRSAPGSAKEISSIFRAMAVGLATGGTLAAIGSAGMTESFSEDSTQPVITYYCTETQCAATTITLTDSDGSALFTVAPEKAYASIVFTCSEMKLDATYTLVAGTDNEEITLTDIITTAGTRSAKTMSGSEGGKMPNNSGNKGAPPSKPNNTTATATNHNGSAASTTTG